MEIQLSKYRLPFREPAEEGVYYIPLDHSPLLCLSDAHVIAYNANRPNEVVDPLTGDILNSDQIKPYISMPSMTAMTADDREHLQFMYFEMGIKAAGRRLGRC